MDYGLLVTYQGVYNPLGEKIIDVSSKGGLSDFAIITHIKNVYVCRASFVDAPNLYFL